MKMKRTYLYLILLSIFTILSLAFSSQKSFWRDESFSVLLSNQPLAKIIETTSTDFSPPLFYFPLHYWIMLVGMNPILLRLLPLAFSLGTIFVLFRVAPHVFPSLKKQNLLNYFLFYGLTVTNQIILYFSAEVRAYSLFMLLALLSAVFLDRAFHQREKKWFFLLLLSNLAMLYTHNTAVLWVGSQFLSIVLLSVIEKKVRYLKWFTLVFGGITILYLPWLRIVLSQTQTVKDSFWIEFDKIKSLQEYIGMFVTTEGFVQDPEVYKRFFDISRLLFFVGGIALWFRQKKHRLNLLVVAGTLVGFYFFSMYISPLLYSRYLSFLAPFALLLVIYSFVWLKRIHPLLFVVIFTLYIVRTGEVVQDLTKEISKTRYEKLALFEDKTVYTDEVLDIMPCIFYHKHCYFVGDVGNTLRYVGAAQLSNVPSLSSWEEITGNEITILYRDEVSDEGKAVLDGFVEHYSVPLGDGVRISEFKKEDF